MGRLAWEMSQLGFVVEANECSIVMATAASNILNGKVPNGTLHPFCYDSMVNEISVNERYQSVNFPDIDITGMENSMGGSLSYTIGDFVRAYSSPSRQSSFDVIVTCFFIDTATNIYEYISVIKYILRNGGRWINYGPLQWHQNALLTPSAEELRQVIEKTGFDVQYWDIDQNQINYRSEVEEHTRYTRNEGYHSLRFEVIYREGVHEQKTFNEANAIRRNIRGISSLI